MIDDIGDLHRFWFLHLARIGWFGAVINPTLLLLCPWPLLTVDDTFFFERTRLLTLSHCVVGAAVVGLLLFALHLYAGLAVISVSFCVVFSGCFSSRLNVLCADDTTYLLRNLCFLDSMVILTFALLGFNICANKYISLLQLYKCIYVFWMIEHVSRCCKYAGILSQASEQLQWVNVFVHNFWNQC